MDIAIIANDKKKELITEFCMAYCGILSHHHICATAITGKYISEATGLTIERLLSGSHGGSSQIASRVAYNEVDILILFRDSSSEDEYNDTEANLVRHSQRSGCHKHCHRRGAYSRSRPRRP